MTFRACRGVMLTGGGGGNGTCPQTGKRLLTSIERKVQVWDITQRNGDRHLPLPVTFTIVSVVKRENLIV